MKKSTRTLCALFSGLLLLMLALAACAPTQEDPGATGTPAPASAPPSSSEEPGAKKTYDEHLTLSWLMAGIKSGGDYSGDDWGRY